MGFSVLKPRDERRGVPAVAARLLHLGVVAVDHLRDGKPGAVALRLLEADAEVLAHPVDREAEIELALVHGLAAVLHLPRLRRALRDHVEHEAGVQPRLLGERDALGERPYESITGRARSNAGLSPPHITVSLPFSAPACPPETGASMKSTPFAFAAWYTLRAASAEAVVWSTSTAPFFMPASAPSLPSATSSRSLSLPTISITKSASFAAAAGVGADWPPCLSTHACALAPVRLYTTTS